jgi:LPXTG-motif cell wall-anchored protein
MFTVIFVPLGSTVAAEQPIKEIDIVTSPDKVLFDVENMKPGDWAERVLEISNSGTQDFGYIISSKLKSGSEKLYNELLLTITSEASNELFKGTLGQFNKLDPRDIKKSESEKLTLRVDFPAELGNEFQGLVTEVEFKIYAEGTLGGLIPAENGIKLPNTATDTMNFIVIGGVLLLMGFVTMMLARKKRAAME